MKDLARIAIFFLLSFLSKVTFGQTYSISSAHRDEDCIKGAAGVNIVGLGLYDTLDLKWSNGRTNVSSINELDAGDYSVQVTIRHKKDTTISFKIQKIDCVVTVSSHFTPNGDDYNDTWVISNTQYYPEFHLFVYDKWGQQVHKQSGTYTKWNGNLGNSGIPVADGTYYYIFFYKGTSGDHLKGDVTILR